MINGRRRMVCMSAIVVSALMLVVSIGMAQVTSSSIAGTVRDPQGAVVPGARITVKSVETGQVRTVETSPTGEYRVSMLSPGTYSVTVGKEGFKTSVQDVTLQIRQVGTVNFALTIGSPTQTVSVTARAPVLQRETSEAGTVITGSQVRNLPLNVRQFMQLAFLVPMVVPAYNDFRSNEVNRGTAVAAGAGSRPEDNDYMIDGFDNEENGRNSFAVNVPVDSVREFKVETGMTPAEFGHGGGTVINVVTRAGTNQFHGSAYEYLRNDKLDSRPFFQPQVSPLKLNQFGAALGGPIKKDKLFFFENYEGYREAAAGNPTVGKVPTLDERNGTFTTPIYDPITKQPFSQNQLPSGDFNQISENILKFIPLPNNPGDPARNFIVGRPSAATDRDFNVIRVDYNGPGSRNTINGRYLLDNEMSNTPPVLPPPANSGGRDFTLKAKMAGVDWNYILSPKLLNHFMVGFLRYHNILATANSYKQDLITPSGITNTLSAVDPLFWAAPSIGIPGFLMTSEVTPNYRTTDDYQLGDSVSWIVGKHSLKMGADLRDIREYMFYTGGNGGWTFADGFTGNNFADFLMGLPSSVSKTARATQWNSKVFYFGGYVQDDWRATSKLTLNLGVRYEIETPINQQDHCGLDFNPSTATMLIPNACINKSEIQDFYTRIRQDVKFQFTNYSAPYNADTNNIAPRVGFAYSFLPNTVLRGGYGIFYGAPQVESLASTNDYAPNTLRPIWTSDPTIPTISYNPEGAVSGEEALATAPLTIFPFISRNFPYGKTQTWNLNIEHRFGSSLLFQVMYQGSDTVNLLQFDNIDARAPGPGNVQQLLPYPQFARIQNEAMWARANFNGISAELSEREWHGFSYLISFTHSRSIDDASTLNQGPQWTDPFHKLQTATGPSDFNVPNRFSASYSYELPIGHGRRFASGTSGVTEKLIAGWGVRGITTFQTGLPQSPGMSLSRTGICAAACTARPDRIGNGNLAKDVRTINRFYDVSAFRLLAPGGIDARVGNAGRNILTGPGINNFDISIFKDTNITEHQTLQFQWNMFNAFNHPQFTNPSTSVESPGTFGVITGARDPRIMQVVLRYIF